MNSTLLAEITSLLQKLNTIESPEKVIGALLELAAETNSSKTLQVSDASAIQLTHNLEQLDGNAYEVVISEVERQLIMYALKRSRYIKTKASEYLGINRNTLDKRIRELKIDY
ncbi:MAG: transcriptional regulator, Fis family protein [Leptonema sp. (in: Bacteria)]|nr:transcriptional regulator, Fis family protein [Leptonema sp. (in: bacteria)]